jgi:signal transduction histidine kinase
VLAITGKLTLKSRIVRAIRRHDFTIVFVTSGLIIPAIIGFAIYDFLHTVKLKDAQFQGAALRSELTLFALALRDDDGASLAAFPANYARVDRALVAVPVVKPFFTYFLNRSNAKAFVTSAIVWEAPRACSVDFIGKTTQGVASKGGDTLRACLAFVPNDTGGHYLYFSLRYPTSAVVRHIQGAPFSGSDHISLELRSPKKTTKLQLVYEPSTLANGRYPSQSERFAGLHEVTAYFGDDPRRPSRSVSGQAFEQDGEIAPGDPSKFITLLVRLDASLMFNADEIVSDRIELQLHKVRASVEVFSGAPTSGGTALRYRIPFDTTGRAGLSFEQIYSQFIDSRARLVVKGKGGAIPEKILWQSDSLRDVRRVQGGALQGLSDRWANLVVETFNYKTSAIRISQEIQSGKSQLGNTVIAELNQEGTLIPEVATKSLFFLSLALGLMLPVSVLWWIGLTSLHRVARRAYAMTYSSSSGLTLMRYRRSRDEIGRLGRAFNLLVLRSRSKNLRWSNRMVREKKEQAERTRIEHEYMRSRMAILDAIGHEIKSPLQTLMIKIPATNDASNEVLRMLRAVEALDLAASVEAGIKNSTIVNRTEDIARYLCKFAKNTSSNGVQYIGPDSGVVAEFDPIAFEVVIDHVMSNAYRHRIAGSIVTITLRRTENAVQVEIHNEGSAISPEHLENIFSLGISSSRATENIGQGLFVARTFMFGMSGSIDAESKDNGVVFVLTLMIPD